jgi:hypothetical protein
MDKSSASEFEVKEYFSSHATLAAIGIKATQLGLFAPIAQRVTIAQKVVKHTPIEKLQDAYLNMLAGGQGMVEINKRIRADRGLQRAFGRSACAEQSVVQDTLDACTVENVQQMYEALDDIYRQHSRGYRHDYGGQWLLLDVDLTGRPCGKKAASARKGYYAGQRGRYGRQVGHVLATDYQELVVSRIYDGQAHLSLVLKDLLEAAERTLDLTEGKRQRTIVRVDAGGGSTDDINWLLRRGYRVLGKEYAAARVQKVVEDVHEWVADPQEQGRQVGWAPSSIDLYCRPVQRIAVRCRKRNGQYGLGLIVSDLSFEDVLLETGQDPALASDLQTVMLAYVYLYDQRGGGVETQIKGGKQGLGTRKRNKKRFEAQQMLVQLETLAHNTLIWARDWLVPQCPRLAAYGIQRLVRDVFTTSGRILLDPTDHIVHIILNSLDPLARDLWASLAALLKGHVLVNLGQI